jgi:PAS domain S-box-containing protein
VLPSVRPEVIEQKKNGIFRSITWILIIAGVMILVGAGSCVVSGISIYRRIRHSIEEIRQIADSAAKGNLSPEMNAKAEALGGVAQSVNRLIVALRRSEELNLQLGTIVESSGDAAIGITMEGHILSWNRGAYRMYGYSVEEIKGKSITLLFAAQQEVDIMRDKISGLKQYAFDTFHVRKSGTRIQVHVIATPILDSKGTRIGMSLLAREIRVARPPSTETPAIRPAVN